MCLDMMVVPSKCMCMSIGDNVHAHSLPKYQSHSSAHVQRVSRSWFGHNRSSWMRVKGKERSYSASGLKVRALTQTVRGAGLSPAQCSALFLDNLNCSKRIIIYL